MNLPSRHTLFRMNRAPVAASAAGPNVVVPAQMGRRIVVVQYVLVGDEPAYVKWQSGDVDLSGPMALAGAGSGVGGTPFELGHFATLPGQALRLHLSTVVNVGGYVNFWFIED